ELLAPDFVNHSAVPEHRHGIEAFKHVNRWVRAGFSDAHYEVEDMIAEADRVACRITLTGTHDGEFQGSPLPASGLPWITSTGTAWPTGSWSSAGP
ncbi:MAG TPA: ester cyclase, partial [Acidimicrobiales bacterium]